MWLNTCIIMGVVRVDLCVFAYKVGVVKVKGLGVVIN